SRQGHLLYANRASAPLLNTWQQQAGGNIQGESLSMLLEAVQSASLRQADFICEDKVFTVVFAPVAGSDYLNVYALDTTEMKKVQLALQAALDEIGQLKNRLQQENRYLQDEIKQVLGADAIIGESDAQKKLLQKVRQVTKTDTTVLITGETGTGKELIARAIHAGSDRKDRPLVKVNCAALPVGLIESELFGHEKGAFTGASSRKIGRFELADGGTIFLDEIGDLPLELQSKLLRVLQEGEIERVGGNRTIGVDVRVIAATNRILAQSISDGEFREELFYRLNVFPIMCPPLRNRKTDIAMLTHHFLQKYGTKIGKRIDTIDAPILARLQAYNWPGNVRELENIIERAIILSEGNTLQLDEAFDLNITPNAQPGIRTIKEVELEMMQSALEDCQWIIEGHSGAAERLGIAPSTLRERIKKHDLQRSGSDACKRLSA
ncbi:MAG: sigma 54-interacting transcriptional regulator, partial [Gammaproteobacteria bacterium]|nr:sigma 54-interacting transcriptional regulator [Gammaproteobacteria bacterium]